MGKATLARQRAIGTIGVARVQRLDEANITCIDTADYERLKTELADLKRRSKLPNSSHNLKRSAACGLAK